MSQHQKFRHRKRLQAVDGVIAAVFSALKQTSKQETQSYSKLLEKYNRFPKEKEMTPKNKYTIFNRTESGYRKSVHRFPKWTKVSKRVNPEFF
ncbi:hypothetical protein WICPIJ_003969 [Wickerhamomyces pijperi]|uniref:54S ribosomal protein L31, mitochondrial n=1 Tax=Wickerhamomyces pijperi TaxID=599730 RepID=A0A9P8Q8K7_WICPI|nr:hypothetical protein WICPIJ_003969 [Wickerhamomyces pijperi]